MAVIGAGLQLVGSFASASGAAAEGRRAKEIADVNAYRMEQQGRYQARQIRKKVSYTNGEAKAQAAANGMMISGSAFDIILDSAVQGEIDAAHAVKAGNDNAHSERLQGSAAQERGNNAAMSHIIGGVSGAFLRLA